MQGFYRHLKGDGLVWTEACGSCKIPREFEANQAQKTKFAEEVYPMAYTINDECINCAACVDTCPVDAISEQGEKHVIDPATCTDCGACVDSCPVDAIEAP